MKWGPIKPVSGEKGKMIPDDDVAAGSFKVRAEGGKRNEDIHREPEPFTTPSPHARSTF